jgi:hypothetical protein
MVAHTYDPIIQQASLGDHKETLSQNISKKSMSKRSFFKARRLI